MTQETHQNTNCGGLDIRTSRNKFSSLCSLFPTFYLASMYYIMMCKMFLSEIKQLFMFSYEIFKGKMHG